MKNYFHLITRGMLVLLLASLTACPGNSGGQSPFVIELRFGSSVSDAYKQVFNNAANHWRRIITAKLSAPDPTPFLPADCGVDGFPEKASVSNDLTIYAVVEPIDGVGQVLGSAGPCLVRGDSLLPGVGTMRFDTADVDKLAAAGQLQETITHEMGHVLGFGTIWKPKGLLIGAGSSGKCGIDPQFIGANAVAVWRAFGKTGNVPVEGAGVDQNGNPIGSGTCEGHWRESIFTKELMTGFLDSGVPNPLSKLTIASLKDLGYTVNLDAAEAYTLGATLSNPRAKFTTPQAQMILLEPRFRWH
jgi:Leishmanolysin